MKKIFIFFFLLSFIVSCRKKIELPDWNTEVLFPIATTTLQLNDLVADSLLRTETDNSLTLVYKGELNTLNFDSLFKIPDTTLTQFFKYPISGFTITPGMTITNQTQQTKYNLNSVELTSAIVRSGTIEVELSSYFEGKTQLTYQLPLTKLNGIPFIVTDTLPASVANIPAIIKKSYDVSGYQFDLRGLNGNSFNTIVSSFKAIALDSIDISSSDSVKISNSMLNIIPEFAKGYFGQETVTSDQGNQAINTMRNITGGTLDLKSFNIIMKIRNGIGVDIQFLLQQVKGSNGFSGKDVLLSFPMIGSAININRAGNSVPSIYPPITYSEYVINLDNTNSNADALIEILPDSISSTAEITLNPLGNISNSNDFVYYGNGIEITLDAEIPLHLIANNLVLLDTVPLTPDTVEKENDLTKKIVNGFLLLDVYNGYPFSASPQLFLMNENFALIDSMVEVNALIEAAELNADLVSKGKKFSKIRMPVNQDKIEKLKLAKYLMIKLIFSTASQPGYIKIYSDYSIDIKVVADINYLVEN